MASPKLNVAELVAKMPETDKEIQARLEAEKAAQQPADPNAKPAEKKPDRWGNASKFTGPDPAAANGLFEQTLAAGRDALVDLTRFVRDPADAAFKDYKAEYFLHSLALYASAPGKEAHEKLVVSVLADALSDTKLPVHVRGFFVRTLRVMGTQGAVAAIGKLLRDEQLCCDAAAALVSLGGAAPLREALAGANGKCRLAIIQSLGDLRDTASAAPLRSALGDNEADVRLTAAKALARIGDAQAIEPMLKLSNMASDWERTKATGACIELAETLIANGRASDARKIYTAIRATRTQPHEAYLRDLADKALGAPAVG
jgi:HEAT repeat protein